MTEDPFKNKQEKLDIKVGLATPEDWQTCKELRLSSLTGPGGRMLGVTPELIQKLMDQTEQEWREETESRTMFSVLAKSGDMSVVLGRVRQEGEGLWRVRNAYVKPGFEGLGVQSKMIALRLREIIKRGGIKAITGIHVDNVISIHNAEKFGFKITEKIDENWYQMELNLTDSEVIKKIQNALNAG